MNYIEIFGEDLIFLLILYKLLVWMINNIIRIRVIKIGYCRGKFKNF